MRTSVLFAAVLALLLISGCATTLQMDRGTVYTVANLDRDHYEILGEAQGEASVSYVFFFFPIGARPEMGVLYNPLNMSPFSAAVGPVRGMALYNAIESVPGADIIIAPRYESTVKGFPPFYWTTTVKVRGKAVVIK